MAKRAREAAAEKTAQEKAVADAEAAERTRVFNEAANKLMTLVHPILEEARIALIQEGIPFQITDNWTQFSIGRPMRPELAISANGEPRKNHFGGTSQAQSKVGTFFYRENELAISVTERFERGAGGVAGGTVEDRVSNAVRAVIESYVESDRKITAGRD
jgi:hypothetical protein